MRRSDALICRLMQDVGGADASEIGARLHVLLGRHAEVIRRMDRAHSRGNLEGV